MNYVVILLFYRSLYSIKFNYSSSSIKSKVLNINRKSQNMNQKNPTTRVIDTITNINFIVLTR